MDLITLGSATPYPRPGRPCSGYLLAHQDTRVWLDAGTGTLAALQAHTAVDRLAAIWISHLHADHCADLLTAFYALRYADLAPAAPIPLYGPAGLADRLAHFLSNSGRSPIEEAFEVHELRDGHVAKIGGLRLVTHAVAHGMPAFGVRVDDGRHSMAFSGDSGPCPGLDRLASGVDLLLCEADSADSADAAAGEPAVHLTPEQAGQLATRAGAGRLVLTHVGPFLTPAQAVARAGAHYAGPIHHAAPGSRFPVGAGSTGTGECPERPD
ncbi:Ribonuclease BN, tRNA processing enzyme [Goodfellowiella coeruleoviolacea]|uniref:Ribonuclease BN, tRNA processing enzyme n=1 Tax=Goodfellowiella coeruleoviolacea TaxID=334858 RepID=A0AAE3GIY4_9PSEU|nr:Ribonuclease BN, tRNA processing enzyme [Goodfellowiella coeruleoviolacea]